MDELIQRITAKTGMDAATAEKAVGLILTFLQKEGPQPQTTKLIEALPGAEAMTAQSGDGGPGAGAGGFMGLAGGVMALGSQLMAAGVSMDQMQGLGSELFAYAREKAGEDVIGEIVASVPGLNQFV